MSLVTVTKKAISFWRKNFITITTILLIILLYVLHNMNRRQDEKKEVEESETIVASQVEPIVLQETRKFPEGMKNKQKKDIVTNNESSISTREDDLIVSAVRNSDTLQRGLGQTQAEVNNIKTHLAYDTVAENVFTTDGTKNMLLNV